MTEVGHCLECGKSLPPDAPEGMCPGCLMRLAVGADSSDLNISVGQEIAGLTITAFLDGGGQGTVYAAKDDPLHRDVAIKFLRPRAKLSKDAFDRFRQEAQIAANLNHPNIVTVYSLGEHDSHPYIVMEYVSGKSLRKVLESQGPLNIMKSLDITLQVCSALETAHNSNVIHRDIKPGNIMLDVTGKAKILDFGLARFERRSSSGKFQESVFGTPYYVPPEQLNHTPVDRSADIYSLGVTLYEMIVGEPPFRAESVPALIDSIQNDPFPDIRDSRPEVDDTLADILGRMVAKNPADRFKTAAACGRAIQNYLNKSTSTSDRGEVGSARETISSAAGAGVPFWKRSLESNGIRNIVYIVTICAILLLFGSVFSYIFSDPKQIRPEPEQKAEVKRLAILLPENAPVSPPGGFLHFNLAYSPDGRRIVYRSGDEGSLALRELNQFEVRVLPKTEGAQSPFFSPDGQWVGYFAATEQKLKKISIRPGSDPVELCDTLFFLGADWGEDRTIIFSQSGDGLMRVSDNGGAVERLTTPSGENGDLYHSHPDVLPGGKAVLFNIAAAIDYKQSAIGIFRFDTGDYEVLIESGSAPRYVDSGHILYSKPGALIAQAFDVERLDLIGSPAPVTEYAMIGKDGAARHYGVSHTGALAYVPDYGEDKTNELYWLDHAGQSEKIVTLPKSYVIPRISPDGRRLAVSVLDWSGQDIWIAELGGNEKTWLTRDSAEDWHPIWTPDGSHIVFTSARDVAFNLYMLASDGKGTLRRLTESPHHQWPHTWTGDWKGLIYVEKHPTTGYDILVTPVDSAAKAEAQALLDTRFNENNPDMSADGKWIAYESDESGRYEIYVRPYPDLSPRWQVSEGGGRQPKWSPDGSSLYFRRGIQMMQVSISSDRAFSYGSPEIMFEDDTVILGSAARNYDLSSDGNRFLMLKAPARPGGSTMNRELVLVENWFEELKRIVPVSGK